MQKNALQFRISSALKNIIGSDLISDDFIAVFELVKNSYDAHATKVEIIFENIYSKDAKIIIKDNGKGMNYDDLVNKWLFVAYSAKKEGTEEDNYDYRDKIKVKRTYAGAKGIGRFSCDRLGGELYLESIKDEKNTKIETLLTDWNKFEEDSNQEFVNISVLHETVNKSSFDNTKGTVLEISNLHSEWNREKLLDLKDSLARLINPLIIQKDDTFKIYLIVDEENGNDVKQKKKNQNNIDKGKLDESEINYFDVVNGEIKNPIFETLQLKTSYIESDVTNNSIITTLFEGGKLVYKIEEKNPFENFKDIHYSIYFLNQSAKSTFTRRMGVQPVEYGHVLVYKNGLRIYPYGERGEDPFKMDNRKAQGYSRFLGTREVLGYISVNGENDNLRETSSRGDGFIKTSTYFNLEKQFYETLKKLEKYTIDITDWGNFLSDDDYVNISQTFIKNKGKDNERVFDVNDNLSKLISSLSSSKSLIKFEVSPDILKILESKSKKSAEGILKSISEKIETGEFGKDEIKKTLKKAEEKLSSLKKQKDEAEDVAQKIDDENKKLKTELNKEIASKLFTHSVIGRDKKDFLALQHQIIHTAGNITWSLDSLIDAINQNKSKEELIEDVKDISLEVQRIVSASRFVTKAGFNTQAEKIKNDIISFINEYVNSIYKPVDSFIHKKRPINIQIEEPKFKKELKFRPFEITVLIDNLFSNSRKANATNVSLKWKKDKKFIYLNFIDNGNGIPNEVADKIFDFKYSNTDGSGIGLYHVKDILNKYDSTIKYIPNSKGAEFLIKIPI